MLLDPRWNMSPAARVLWNAAQLIREHGHCKHMLQDGNKLCLYGAINKAATGNAIGKVPPIAEIAYNLVSNHLKDDPVLWNNRPTTTPDQVIAALEETALTIPPKT